jgi:hypothetical protein
MTSTMDRITHPVTLLKPEDPVSLSPLDSTIKNGA